MYLSLSLSLSFSFCWSCLLITLIRCLKCHKCPGSFCIELSSDSVHGQLKIHILFDFFNWINFSAYILFSAIVHIVRLKKSLGVPGGAPTIKDCRKM